MPQCMVPFNIVLRINADSSVVRKCCNATINILTLDAHSCYKKYCGAIRHLLRMTKNYMTNELTTTDSLNDLRAQLRQFTAERQWEQFHTPKNLASALIVEAAELLEPFQWLSSGSADELGAEKLQAVRHEMADVMTYLIMLADQLNIDLIAATNEKIQLNALKYPSDVVRGDARKYNEYD